MRLQHPAAARAWAKTRDAFILKKFNKGGWTCDRTIMDPCLFRFTKDGETAFALIHTDDCDMIGSNDTILQSILDICHAEWECKEVDASFMLGVKRLLTVDKITDF